MAQDQRVAVVAGGSAGVGRAVVSRLREAGYRVGVLARGRERLDALGEIYGDRVYCLSCDVADAAAVARAGATIEEVVGPVDVWINTAMLTSFSPFMSMEAEEFEEIVDATLLGVVNGTRTALSLMERRNRGRIVRPGPALHTVRCPTSLPTAPPSTASTASWPRFAPNSSGKVPRSPWVSFNCQR